MERRMVIPVACGGGFPIFRQQHEEPHPHFPHSTFQWPDCVRRAGACPGLRGQRDIDAKKTILFATRMRLSKIRNSARQGTILALVTGIVLLDTTALGAGYPPEVKHVTYTSSGDGSQQPALFWKPDRADGPVPLLVALHTWSGGYDQAAGETKYAEWCQKMGWAFVHPHFRGPNWTPEALGSDLVVADIISSVEFAKSQTEIDPTRIYCVGVSGGGHAALLMAGRAPEIWAGVSAWCGISDIEAWYDQGCVNGKVGNYAKHIGRALGGPPGSNEERKNSARHRSPVAWLGNAAALPLDINHGVNDGRKGSVPFTHSLHAWNAVVPPMARVDGSTVDGFYETRKSPEPFTGKDPLYGKRPPVFRKNHGNTRITIFQGGHEIIHEAALNWLAAQRKGKPAKWEIAEAADLDSDEKATQSGK
jgi:pimeloyl-ACP methyl ester carboxylesterase